MLALAAIWKAVHETRRRGWWLTAASLAYGLAVGARPSLLFGAVILLVPVVQAWRERRKVWAPLLAATVPIMLIGLGLMLYNALRFNNPFEFGQRYVLSGQRQVTLRFFSLDYLWFNFRVYFLEPARWVAHFPFVHDIAVPPRPVSYMQIETPFGILTNIPLVWLALAVPLAWQNRSERAGSTLRWFVTAVVLLFGTCALTVGLFWSASFRYEVDFLPALLLLAVIGILGLERALAPTSESGQACQPVWRRAVRWGWGLLLGFSVAFNLLVSVERCAEAQNNLGGVLAKTGKIEEAIAHDEQALRLNPDYAEAHYNLGVTLQQAGQVPEAIGHYEQALRIKVDDAEAHNNLGNALDKLARPQEAIKHYEQAVRIRPDFAEAHYNLGVTLEKLGHTQDAIGHYEQALRIKPDLVQAQFNLGNALLREGKLQEAIGHFEQALRIKPDFADAHYNLGVALETLGRTQEAIQHYKQALRIKPDFTQAQNALARLQASQ
jgi:tetratricopeptide (TPR) repeat protein